MIEDILPRLSKVKQTSRGNWLARCPAHDDKSPSLTIHAADDGRVLCKCWAGCSFAEIAEATGLGWEPWFPPKQASDFKPPIRRPYPAADVLEAVAGEIILAAVIVSDVAQGKEPSPEERDLLLVAASRMAEAGRLALG